MSKFLETLENFKGAITNAKQYAREAALLALDHYREHGDTSYLNQFGEVLTSHAKNFTRKNPYLIWACTFANVKWENEKFSKDMSRKDMVIDMEKAAAKDFWDFVPEKVAKAITGDDIIARLKAQLKSFENGSTFTLDDAGRATLALLKSAIAGVSPVKVVSAPAPVENVPLSEAA